MRDVRSALVRAPRIHRARSCTRVATFNAPPPTSLTRCPPLSVLCHLTDLAVQHHNKLDPLRSPRPPSPPPEAAAAASTPNDCAPALPVWARHSKHVLVLTSSGKPVFSRHGTDADALALTSVVQAVVSRCAEGGDPLRSMTTADGARFVFLSAGPLTLLAVGRAGDGEGALRSALAALHGALTLTLTGPVIERTAGRSGGDLRPALAGSRPTLLAVLRACNRSPAPWLGPSLPVLSIGAGARGRLASQLAAGCAGCPGTVYALVVAGHALAGWAQRRDYGLRPLDGFLLAALVQSGSSFRRSRASWTPVCLPGLNPDGYLQAWVTLLAEVPPRAPGRDAGYNGEPPGGGTPAAGGGDGIDSGTPATSPSVPTPTPTAGTAGSSGTAAAYHPDVSPPGVFLVLVSQATGPSAVQALSDASASIAQQLRDSGVLDAVTTTLAAAGGAGCGDFPASRYREPGCLHFVHAWRPLGQHTQSLLPPVVATHGQRKALLRGYAHVYDRLLVGAVTDADGDDAPGSPPSLRHYVASFPAVVAAAAAADGGGGGGSGAPPGVATLAGLRTTHGTLLAAWDASVAHADVPGAIERLAKALRADNDKLLAAHPGVISSPAS
jgi:hypothetical protein